MDSTALNGASSLAVEHLPLKRENLAGKTMLVTGGGRGIGREIARAFAWAGARVVIAEISEEGRETERQVCEAGGVAQFVQTDVSSPEQVARLARQVQESFGPVEILINNAILCPVASLLEMDVELWDRVMAVNLRGAFLTCKAFLPDMLSLGQGVIINMISTDAMPNLSAYIASKQGLAALSQSLAGEVGSQGVRVIAFAPGFVDTPGLRSAARGLAAGFGLSEEQFMKLPVHPAYQDAAMPAGHAAAATAFLVANLTDEYHGEQVNGYTVLERAGFISSGPAPTLSLPSIEKQPEPSPGDPQKTLEIAARFSQIIADSAEELNRLPIFVRPMARAGFKSKSGLSLQDWAHLAEDLASRFKQWSELPAEERAALSQPALPPQLKERLGRLIVYYQETPAETARFTKDPQVIEAVTRTAEERVQVIRELIQALDL